ncbi:anthranilate phosphoribosyltransferase [Armatimonas rosea]|uniref:anthranilate phosphoribosyltransferase n=1 Tax=Armatimonas rosea TaxID=685828 RepID=UPI00160C1107|nr:anthranilate phosphoribosyltransferase [Armatimonas rosea]
MPAVKEVLAKVIGGHMLSEAEAEAAMGKVMAGEATPAQLGALLTALRLKGESVEELTGFARGMRAHSLKVTTTRRPLVDTCGTGGAARKTFNVSTTAAFVAAAAGVAIAKHGNRAATSKFGSADVLEALGARLDLSPESVGRCIDEVGIGFLFARSHHPAMKHAAPVRAELGFRTIFNALGPLTNPAGATRQVLGVYDGALCEPLATVLLRLGAEHVLVVHGKAGLDELSTFGETLVAEGRDGTVTTYTLTPADLGLSETTPEALAPHDDPAATVRAILAGEPGPRREIVLANAGAALYVAGSAESLRAGIALAAQAIDSGAARTKLEQFVEFTARDAS